MLLHFLSMCARHFDSPVQGLASSEVLSRGMTCYASRNSYSVALHYHKAGD